MEFYLALGRILANQVEFGADENDVAPALVVRESDLVVIDAPVAGVERVAAQLTRQGLPLGWGRLLLDSGFRTVSLIVAAASHRGPCVFSRMHVVALLGPDLIVDGDVSDS